VKSEVTNPLISIILSGPRGNGRERLLRVIQEQCFDGCELIDDPAALIYAKGNYLLFWDENVLPEPCFVGKMYALAEKTQADITICDYWTINAAGEKRREAGIKKNWLRSCAQVFNRKDCPDHILQIAPSVLGNRMYRAAFIREWISRWDYPAVFDVLTFGAVSLAAADSIAWLEDALITDYGQNRTGTETLWDRLEQSVEKIEGLKLADEIENSVIKLLVGTAVAVLKNGIADFSSQSAAELYERTHREFNGPRLKDINPANLYNAQLFREFRTVQKHDYQTMKCMVSRELVVSVTSFPARIGLLAQSLESVYAQSRKPDRVVLWLARDQFPGGQEDLPQSLVDLIAQGKLELFWCSDLRGHKKYLGSFRKYPDGLIVTVDDDLIYPRDMLECLWKSYLLYPNAVSALRTHLMLLSESGKILPYQSWIMETDACIHLIYLAIEIILEPFANPIAKVVIFAGEGSGDTAFCGRCILGGASLGDGAAYKRKGYFLSCCRLFQKFGYKTAVAEIVYTVVDFLKIGIYARSGDNIFSESIHFCCNFLVAISGGFRQYSFS